MDDKPTRSANDIIMIDTTSRSGKHATSLYFVCEVIESGVPELKELGTWYNCLDTKGKKVVIFDPLDEGHYSVIARRKWFARSMA